MLELSKTGTPGSKAAEARQTTRANKPKNMEQLIEDLVSQTLSPPAKAGQKNATLPKIHTLGHPDWRERMAELVREALNQTLTPGQDEVGAANALAAQIRDNHRIDVSKSMAQLAQEALQQTLANPKQTVTQHGRHINQAVPLMQSMADTLDAIRAKVEAVKDFADDMVKGNPYNQFLSKIQTREGIRARVEATRDFVDDVVKGNPYNQFLDKMHRQAIGAINEINNLIDRSEFAGNKLLGQDGESFHVALTDGSILEVKAGDLKLQAEEQDFRTKRGVQAFQHRLIRNLGRLAEFKKAVVQQMNQLETEVKRAEHQLAQDLGLDPTEINMNLAAEIATLASSEAVTWTMKEILDAQQVHGLLRNPLY